MDVRVGARDAEAVGKIPPRYRRVIGPSWFLALQVEAHLLQGLAWSFTVSSLNTALFSSAARNGSDSCNMLSRLLHSQ